MHLSTNNVRVHDFPKNNLQLYNMRHDPYCSRAYQELQLNLWCVIHIIWDKDSQVMVIIE